MDTSLLFTVALVVLAFVLLFSVVKIVPQGREMTVERFGKYTRTLSPGISILTPFVERIGRRMNMMEQVLDVPQQEVITKDNAMVKVDAIVFIQVMEASAAAYRIENLPYAITQLCSTNLRTVVGSMDLDEVLFQRDNINSRLLTVIDAATEPWGVKVEAVEMKDVEIPEAMQRAMAREAEAMREKRARIIKAEAEHEASVRLGMAAREIAANPIALELRRLQTVSEVGAENNSTTVLLIPTEFLALASTLNRTLSATADAAERSTAPAAPTAPTLPGDGQ